MADNRGGFKKIDLLNSDNRVVVTATEIVIDAGRMILKGKGFKLLPHQIEMDGVAYMVDGIVPFKARVTLSTDRQINLQVLGAADKKDRRDSLKVPSDAIETIIEVRSTGTNQRHYMMTEDVIELKNLSMGGVGFASNRPYFKHQRLTLQLCSIRQDFIIQAEVLRKIRNNGGFLEGYRYSYGCRFISDNEAKNRMLCEHVFKLEMMNNQKVTGRK